MASFFQASYVRALNIIKSNAIGLAKGLVAFSLLALFSVWTAPSASAETVSVIVGGGPTILAFEPAQVEVQPGDQIHFEIGAGAPHNVVFDSNTPSDFTTLTHKDLEQSGSWDVTVPDDATPGTYDYWCDPHRGAGMLGKIVVKG
ncbi:MAG: plastocyanin/azurin family copper-binding protein [Cyanobacteria bacterium P01_F01_bin.42]